MFLVREVPTFLTNVLLSCSGKNESNKSRSITFHKNTLFALNDGNFKSRSLEMSLENISKLTAWCICNSCTVMFWYSSLYKLFSYLLTHPLTPWSRVLLEKLIGSQPVKKFPAFYGTRKFITAFTSAQHLSLTWARSIQSMPPHSTFRRSISRTPGSSERSFSLRFFTKTLYAPLSPPYLSHALLIPFLILSPEQYWMRSTDHKLLII